MTRRTLTLLGLALVALSPATPAAGSELPTPGEVRGATERFLAAHAASPAPRAGGSGGVGGGGVVGDLFPQSRVVCLYGAPQMGQTILGMRSPAAAARKLAAQSASYAKLGDRPVIGAFDLVSVFATAGGGSDDMYRTRQDDEVIGIYLDQARKADARLMLDIQPGRSTFTREVAVLEEWLAEPDVDLAIDPEWNVGRRGVPGRTEGRATAREVNAVSRELARIVRANDLPPKLLVVHQFRRGSVRQRSKVRQRPGVQVLLNFDGIGAPGPKEAGYAALSTPRLFDGFSLFYRRDTPLMKPAEVLALEPEPDFLLYQ